MTSFVGTPTSISSSEENYAVRKIAKPGAVPQRTRTSALTIVKDSNSSTCRSCAVWHDHATIAGKGYMLVTCNVVYNSAVFKRDDEIQQGSETNIQAYIEEPEIHIANCFVEFFLGRPSSFN